MHALSSAALVFAITQGCTTDGVCDCGREPGLSLLQSYRRKHGSNQYTYAWRGCHDNIAMATRFSKDFLDRREVKKTKSVPRKVLNLHNNDLGRKVSHRKRRKDRNVFALDVNNSTVQKFRQFLNVA